MTAMTVPTPSGPVRALGVLGILGGAVLLVAFLPVQVFDGSTNLIRLLLYCLGAAAVAVAVQGRAAPASRLGRVVAAAVVAANLWYVVMIVLGTGRPQLPEPDPEFRRIAFVAGLAMWLADSAFGWVTLRLRTADRLGAIALAVGSLLAILGMSHLELTSSQHPTIFGPISLVGIALNGLGWILLGLDVALGRGSFRRLPAQLTGG